MYGKLEELPHIGNYENTMLIEWVNTCGWKRHAM